MTPTPTDQRFRPREHIRRGADFQRAFNRRRSASNDWLIVYGCENGLTHSRLGLSVGRKWGGAVVRNRLRRLYREVFRLTKSELPTGLDLVLVPRTAKLPPLATMREAFPRLVRNVVRKLEAGKDRPT